MPTEGRSDDANFDGRWRITATEWCSTCGGLRQGIDANATLIAGVSGGLDSMVLVETLHRVGINFHVAHVNYHLRGEAPMQTKLGRRMVCGTWRPCHVLNARGSDRARRASGFRKIRVCPLRTVARRSQRSPGPPGLHRHGPPRRRSSRNRALHLMRSADPLALGHACCGCRTQAAPSVPHPTRAELAEAQRLERGIPRGCSNAKPDYLRNRIGTSLPLFDSLRPGTTAHVAIGRTSQRCGPSSRQNAMLPPHAAGK